jgi:hypothetical protein
MAIILLPQPTHINRDANRSNKPPARLKCATVLRKIKESSKVLARVRLFRLLPQSISKCPELLSPRCTLETIRLEISCGEGVGTIKITKS